MKSHKIPVSDPLSFSGRDAAHRAPKAAPAAKPRHKPTGFERLATWSRALPFDWIGMGLLK